MAKAIRIDQGLKRGEAFLFQVDGKSVPAFAGETVAAALMAEGRRTLRVTAGRREGRGYFCGMGVCWDCMMWLEGQGSMRSCRLIAAPGMRLRTMEGAGVGRASPEPAADAAAKPGDVLGWR
jgi:D-hydroxyproline dehydrogenase subunit gamma